MADEKRENIKAEAIANPPDEPTEAITEPTTEPITEPPTEPITEPTTEPITEPTTEPAPSTQSGMDPEGQQPRKSRELESDNGSSPKRPKLEAEREISQQPQSQSDSSVQATQTESATVPINTAVKDDSTSKQQPIKFGSSSKGFGLGSFSASSAGGTNYFTQAALKIASGPGAFSSGGGLSRFASTQSKAATGPKEHASSGMVRSSPSHPSAVLPEKYEYKTGEEDELTLVKCRGKLYILDLKERTWKSKGEGALKLNVKTDTNGMAKSHARLVMWCAGSKRLVLNVRLWDGMAVEKVSAKQVRFLASELDQAGSPTLNTYLFSTTQTEADTLLEAIKRHVKIHDKPSKQLGIDNDSTTQVTFTKANSNLSDIARQSAQDTAGATNERAGEPTVLHDNGERKKL